MGGLKFDFHTGQRAAGARVAVVAKEARVAGAGAAAEEARAGGAGGRVASSFPPSLINVLLLVDLRPHDS